MKKYLFLIWALAHTFYSIAQSDSTINNKKNATLIVTGKGRSFEDAKTNALRNAIEQAFGTFISAKTEILNDSLIADQISSVSTGNINSYEINSDLKLSDGTYEVTIKAIVSIDNLAKYVESKGVKVDFKGNIFAVNIKQQKLNENGELDIIYNLVGNLHELLQTSFDYTINSVTPKQHSEVNDIWEIPIVVNVTANQNMDNIAQHLIKTLASISLNKQEADAYKEMNKKTFQVQIVHNNKSHFFVLRKLNSLAILSTLINQWNFYTGSSIISNTIEEYPCKGESDYYDIGDNYQDFWGDIKDQVTIKLPSISQLVTRYKWSEIKPLSYIEKISSYSIKPSGVTSFFKFGGIVLSSDSGRVTVASLYDERLVWDSVTSFLKDYKICGYGGWHMPSRKDIKLLNDKLYSKNKKSFYRCLYMTSEISNSGNYLGFSFNHGCEMYGDQMWHEVSKSSRQSNYLRPIRTITY